MAKAIRLMAKGKLRIRADASDMQRLHKTDFAESN